MARFPYIVCFLDADAFEEDEHREWVACFEIEAETAEQAKLWGDTLAAAYVARWKNLRVTQSSTKPPGSWDDTDRRDVPTIQFGHAATDEEIGW